MNKVWMVNEKTIRNGRIFSISSIDFAAFSTQEEAIKYVKRKIINENPKIWALNKDKTYFYHPKKLRNCDIKDFGCDCRKEEEHYIYITMFLVDLWVED